MKFATVVVAVAGTGVVQAHVAPRQNIDLPGLLLKAPAAFMSGLTGCFDAEASGLEYLQCVTDNTLPAIQKVIGILPKDLQSSIGGVLETAKSFEAEIKTCVKEETPQALKDCVQGKLTALEKEVDPENVIYIKAIDSFSEDVFKCSQKPGGERLKCTTAAVGKVLQGVVQGLLSTLLGGALGGASD